MELPVFSKRHSKRIKSGQLSVFLKPSTKQRIYYVFQDCDIEVGHTDNTGWNYTTYLTEDLGDELCKMHGWPCLKTYSVEKKGMQEAKISEFLREGAPIHIFDAIELFSKELEDAKYGFQEKINTIFSEAQLPWRLSDDVIFQVNSQYMAEVLSYASKLLGTSGFQGAKQEFQEARTDLDSGDNKGAIHHANLSLESTMKAILGVDRERPGTLFRMVIDSGIIPEYYDDFLKNFEQVLRVVNIARNEEKGAGHGQGSEVVDVPKHLAELVLNFCGSLTIFLVNHYIDAKPKERPTPEPELTYVPDDDIPF